VARRCRAAGGRTLVVPTDVREPAQVTRLGEEAALFGGRIDGWVNNAAVGSYARFGEWMEDFRAIVETNLMGSAYGTAVALRHLRATGNGVIVNVASALSEVPIPYFSAYIATKHAIAGMTKVLRQELLAAGERSISVCLVLPGSVNTPFYDHAANHMGRPVAPLWPASSPHTVADRVVGLLERPRSQLYVGVSARLLDVQWRLLPGLTERLLGHYVPRVQFREGFVTTADGNVREHVDGEPARVQGASRGSAWKTVRSVWRPTRPAPEFPTVGFDDTTAVTRAARG